VIVSEGDLAEEFSEATRRSDYRLEPAVKRAEGPKGSAAWILEIEPLIPNYGYSLTPVSDICSLNRRRR